MVLQIENIKMKCKNRRVPIMQTGMKLKQGSLPIKSVSRVWSFVIAIPLVLRTVFQRYFAKGILAPNFIF